MHTCVSVHARVCRYFLAPLKFTWKYEWRPALQIPGHVHTYDVGDGKVRSFRAAPAPGRDARIMFAVYGDMGESTHPKAKSPGYAYFHLHPSHAVQQRIG